VGDGGGSGGGFDGGSAEGRPGGGGGSNTAREAFDEAPGEAPEVAGVVLPGADQTQGTQGSAGPWRRVRPLLGRWRQVAGDRRADFAEGGYYESLLEFRSDGRLNVLRRFGGQQDVTIQRRLAYRVTEGDALRLQAPPGPPPQRLTHGLELTDADGRPIIIAPPAIDLPTRLELSLNGDRLRLAGKAYERVEPEDQGG
jgi:hypothetical protein